MPSLAQPIDNKFFAMASIVQSSCPNLSTLMARYDALLLDAYGVLVDKTGPLPGAQQVIARLNQTGMAYYIVTNSASRSPASMAQDFQRLGLAIDASRLITSGSLLKAYFVHHKLLGHKVVLLGPTSAQEYVRLAGGVCVAPGQDAPVIVLADQAGFPMLETLDKVLNTMLCRLDQGQALHLVLPNPDLIYPSAPGKVGITAGALAALLEAVLAERYPEKPAFVRLGKPFAPIFDAAIAHANSRNVLMIGDQLATDIAGAKRAGIDSLHLASGISPLHAHLPGISATYTAVQWTDLL